MDWPSALDSSLLPAGINEKWRTTVGFPSLISVFSGSVTQRGKWNGDVCHRRDFGRGEERQESQGCDGRSCRIGAAFATMRE